MVSIGLLGVSLSIYFSCTIELILIKVNIQKKKMMVHLNLVREVEWLGIFLQGSLCMVVCVNDQVSYVVHATMGSNYPFGLTYHPI